MMRRKAASNILSAFCAAALMVAVAFVLGPDARAEKSRPAGPDQTPSESAQTIEYLDRLTPDGQGIVRRPPPFPRDGGVLTSLPVFKSSNRSAFQLLLFGADLRGLDLRERLPDLLMSTFDDRTAWPAGLPAGFDPAKFMEAGKNPGLGVRKLHQQGVTGQGVGVAVIDQILLVDHLEYRDRLRLYEEIHCLETEASEHGPAAASIAVGKTVGVAPGADLYGVSETHGTFGREAFSYDFTHLARAIDRVLEVNRRLPEGKKIRVISATIGWNPQQKGYAEANAAVMRAEKEGLFVVSSSLFETSGGRFSFLGLGREPLADPDASGSFGPARFWADSFYSGSYARRPDVETLLVPMDSRTVASPAGPGHYAFYREGGLSWAIPYLAGLYALACQVRPEVTPELFWATALETGDSIELPPREKPLDEADIEKRALEMVEQTMERFKADMKRLNESADPERAMAGIYSSSTGKKVERLSEAEFRAWIAARTRERLAAVGKPVVLKKIVNPAKLIAALERRG